MAAKGRSVICLEDGERFDSASAAARHYGCNTGSIYYACRFGQMAKDRHFYYADQAEPEESFFRNKTITAVRCVETGMTFESQKAAAEWLGCPAAHIAVGIQRGTRVKGYHWEKVVGRKWVAVCVRGETVCDARLFDGYDAATRFVSEKADEDGMGAWQIAAVSES